VEKTAKKAGASLGEVRGDPRLELHWRETRLPVRERDLFGDQ
jgi:hypothetical protein